MKKLPSIILGSIASICGLIALIGLGLNIVTYGTGDLSIGMSYSGLEEMIRELKILDSVTLIDSPSAWQVSKLFMILSVIFIGICAILSFVELLVNPTFLKIIGIVIGVIAIGLSITYFIEINRFVTLISVESPFTFDVSNGPYLIFILGIFCGIFAILANIASFGINKKKPQSVEK